MIRMGIITAGIPRSLGSKERLDKFYLSRKLAALNMIGSSQLNKVNNAKKENKGKIRQEVAASDLFDPT